MKNHNGKEEKEDCLDLKSLVLELNESIRTRHPPRIQGLSRDEHELAPYIPKGQWARLGDAIKVAERPTSTAVPGEKWISLRCDGTGFSKFLPRLRAQGVLPESGFSDQLAEIMQKTCRALMEKFHATCGFTQSDEMTVLIAPANIVRGVQQCHPYNGRIQKLCSLAAATATAHFNAALMQIYLETQEGMSSIVNDNGALATFDCRVGMYDSKDEAMSLLLWRAYDAGVNGVSDAVHHLKGFPERKQITKLPTGEKLIWLLEKSLLPLKRHQREGTYYVKRKVLVETTDRATGKAVTCLRSRLVHIPGNLINLYRDGKMFPPDDKLEE